MATVFLILQNTPHSEGRIIQGNIFKRKEDISQ